MKSCLFLFPTSPSLTNSIFPFMLIKTRNKQSAIVQCNLLFLFLLFWCSFLPVLWYDTARSSSKPPCVPSPPSTMSLTTAAATQRAGRAIRADPFFILPNCSWKRSRIPHDSYHCQVCIEDLRAKNDALYYHFTLYYRISPNDSGRNPMIKLYQ